MRAELVSLRVITGQATASGLGWVPLDDAAGSGDGLHVRKAQPGCGQQVAAIGAGMKFIDLGCCGGAVTVKLARLVAPGGFVTGVDMDEWKLGLARKFPVGARCQHR